VKKWVLRYQKNEKKPGRNTNKLFEDAPRSGRPRLVDETQTDEVRNLVRAPNKLRSAFDIHTELVRLMRQSGDTALPAPHCQHHTGRYSGC
jgi:transposase